ncbi:MAG: signal peptidase I [Flavobacteriales bacterium]|nr:signal peptidase I [Flavobacteriales bacterium]
MKSLLARWRKLNEWLRALVIAVAVLGGLHAFVLRWVTVQNTSMYRTLLPGDLLAVNILATWTGLDRNDVVVFRDPVQDDRVMARRDLLVKRIVALPGDIVQIKAGTVFVNGKRMNDVPGLTRSWLVRLKQPDDATSVIEHLQLPMDFVPTGRSFIELPLNEVLAEELDKGKLISDAEPMGAERGSPDHIFPYSPAFRWNADNYGPITIPAEGDTVQIDLGRLPLYDRIITRYEGRTLEAARNDVLMNGEPLREYVIAQDYCFVLGDSRNHSADSRYWGFLPMDHIVGRAAFVLLNKDADRGKLRGDRWFWGVD